MKRLYRVFSKIIILSLAICLVHGNLASAAVSSRLSAKILGCRGTIYLSTINRLDDGACEFSATVQSTSPKDDIRKLKIVWGCSNPDQNTRILRAEQDKSWCVQEEAYCDFSVNYNAGFRGGLDTDNWSPTIYATVNGVKLYREFDLSDSYSFSLNGKKLSGTALTNAVNTEAGKAFSGLNKNMNDFEKAKAVHDYLVAHTVYSASEPSDFSYYGVLLNHKGACEGYAAAYQMLLKRLGIPTVVVAGTVTGYTDSHAWNMVELNHKWYHVDVTWDDPIPDRGDNVRYTYFLQNDSQITGLGHSAWSVFVDGTLPSSPDTSLTGIPWQTMAHEDFNRLETPATASVALDTSSYKTAAGGRYIFLAKSNLGEFISAKAADSTIVEVGEPDPDGGGWLIPIKGLKAGSTTVTATSACGATASFPVVVSKAK